jgi:hypothetical protein
MPLTSQNIPHSLVAGEGVGKQTLFLPVLPCPEHHSPAVHKGGP